VEKKISKTSRRELVGAVGERYSSSSKIEKARILDEFVAVTKYHRKYAVRLLNGHEPSTESSGRSRSRLYDAAVREALVVLWETSDRLCGKRLRPLLPVLVPALERHGHLSLDDSVRRKLLAISSATIDRLLAEPRGRTGRKRPARKPAIRAAIPVRTFADWNEPPPGYMEGDLVAHCGDVAAGAFAHTLVLTDIDTGWTECLALLVREGTLIADALDRLRETMPFPLRGFDSDNGSEFVNDVMLTFCRDNGIEFTRSRPHHKNDQAWVEQKNGSVVRRFVGYGRIEGVRAVDTLSRLYGVTRLFVNFFQPSFKLAYKERVGARIRKHYHKPETPCSRLLASVHISEAMKDRLRGVAMMLDPLKLLDEIRATQHELAGLIAGDTPHIAPRRDADLDRFLKSLATTWRDGEVRPTHRSAPKPRRDWRTRRDPFENVWSEVLTWLDIEPDRNAKEILQRLQNANPGVFGDGQVRTLQRKIKDWRSTTARKLVFAHYEHTTAPDCATQGSTPAVH
jgi:hypothetical protein